MYRSGEDFPGWTARRGKGLLLNMNLRVVVICGLAISAVAAVICLPRSKSPAPPASQPAEAPPRVAENAVIIPAAETSSPRPAPLLIEPEAMAAAAPPPMDGERELPKPAKAASQAKASSTTAATAPAGSPKPGKNYRDVGARAALIFVGADPEAEAYWFEAINDPGLSPHERQDLIEDLNEEGFSDPRHPTVEDLPLILSRLALIEALAPEAMDVVNSDAFAEARKDLLKMAALTQP